MHLDDYLRPVGDHLAAAAALADDRTREIAARLAEAAAPSLRLAILDALSAAADEITAALLDSPGSPAGAVRVDGGAVRIDVTPGSAEPAAPRTDDGDTSARISLRLSESLKSDIEAAAAREGVSVNTWLVRAAGAALAGPFAGFGAGFSANLGNNLGNLFAERAAAAGRRNTHHITGWING